MHPEYQTLWLFKWDTMTKKLNSLSQSGGEREERRGERVQNEETSLGNMQMWIWIQIRLLLGRRWLHLPLIPVMINNNKVFCFFGFGTVECIRLSWSFHHQLFEMKTTLTEKNDTRPTDLQSVHSNTHVYIFSYYVAIVFNWKTVHYPTAVKVAVHFYAFVRVVAAKLRLITW